MNTRYSQSSPWLNKDEHGNVIQIGHTHSSGIDYNSFENSHNDNSELNTLISSEKVAVKSCITFFKTIANSKSSDVMAKASAKAALTADEAYLADLRKHIRK